MDKIYIVRGTERVGPFTEAEIRAQLAAGALQRDSLVWWEGLPAWTPISSTALAGVGLSVPPPIEQKTCGLAITSLVLGCIGWLFPVAFGPAGVITGHLAQAEIRRDPMLKGKGMALAGVVLGYIWSSFIVLAFVSIVAISVLIALGNQVKGVFTTISSQMVAPASPNP